MAKKNRKKGIKKVTHPQSNKTQWFDVYDMWAIIIFIAAGFFIYSNTLNAQFVFDDGHNILENFYIRIADFSISSLFDAAFKSPCTTRPIAMISFALNYYFGGYNVYGYHLVNIVIHIITAILLYFFIKITLSLNKEKEYNKFIPFFTSLIWLVHPLQTQSITYIIQRMNSLCVMFFIASMLMYIIGRLYTDKKAKILFFFLCFIFGLFSLASKEIAATLPVFIVLYEWYFFQDLKFQWFKKNLMPLILFLFFIISVVFLYLGINPLEKTYVTYTNYDFTLAQRVLTEFRVIILYITLLAMPYPSRLNVDYDFPISFSIINPYTTLLSIIIVIGLIVLAVYIAKKQKILSFCILWFLGNLFIESSVIALDLVFEHRTYMPSMMFFLPIVIFVFHYFKQMKIPVLCLLVILFSVWTYKRNMVWATSITLWQDCVKKSPKKFRPHNNLGTNFAQKGDFTKAILHFLQAVHIDPTHPKAYFNLAKAYHEVGDVNNAIINYKKSISLDQNNITAYNNLAMIFMEKKETDKALYYYSMANKVDPNNALTHYSWANALAILKNRDDEAIKHYEKALQLRSDYPEAHNNLGILFTKKREFQKAQKHFITALQLKPDYPEAQRNLKLIQMVLNNKKK